MAGNSMSPKTSGASGTPLKRTGLLREMGLLGLAATGICSMLGAGINVIPFMIQRNVPGIGPYVLPAYLFAAIPAIFAALAYAILASAMPRAGGSYVYASRALNPYLGFVASFSQWFGLCIAIGVVSYVLIPFLRDIAAALELEVIAGALDRGAIRVILALAFLWTSADRPRSSYPFILPLLLSCLPVLSVSIQSPKPVVRREIRENLCP
jgi:APA family basic amino acid/polyamine antiporter